MADIFTEIMQRIRSLEKRADAAPAFRWGVVTSVAPLTIRLDGDSADLFGSPSTLVAGLTVGVRVRVEIQAGRATITGVAKGGDTGWKAVSVPSASGTCEWRKLAGIIYVRFEFTLSSALAAGQNRDPILTLPSAAWPATPTPITVGGGLNLPATGRVWTNGNLSIRNNHSSSEDLYRGFGQWPK